MSEGEKEICSSCKREIFEGEQSCVFKGDILCYDCNRKLRATQNDSESDAAMEIAEETCISCGKKIAESEKAYVVDNGLICVTCGTGSAVSEVAESEEVKKEKAGRYTKQLVAKKKGYNQLSFCFGIPGIILQITGLVILMNYSSQQGMTEYHQEPAHITFARLLTLLGCFLLVVGFAYYAKMKGRSPAWCLVGFLGIIGLVILICLKDKYVVIPGSFGETCSPSMVGESKDLVDVTTVSRKTSKLGVASFVIGIVSVIIPFILLFIPGLILGLAALIKIGRSGGKLRGIGYAIAGLILSCIGACLNVLVVLWTQ